MTLLFLEYRSIAIFLTLFQPTTNDDDDDDDGFGLWHIRQKRHFGVMTETDWMRPI